MPSAVLPYALLVVALGLCFLAFRAGRASTRREALHDVLTGLPNRALFTDRVERALAGARRDGARPVVMLLDLDRFKEINDTLGHHHGDAVLRQVGPRITEVLRSSDTVARLGGDEFGVLLPGAEGGEAVREVADKILEALRRPYPVQGSELEVDASLGIAVFPEHGQDVESLLRRADVAMYTAKGSRSGQEVYGRTSPARPDALALAEDLRRGMEADELSLVFQPKVCLLTGEVHGAEALVRWLHPHRGLVPPSSFVDQADHAGVMRPLTLHVLDRALRQAGVWRASGLELHVAVNISARSLLDRGLPVAVSELLDATGADADTLLLELTEGTIMADPDRARQVLGELDELGVGLSIDDFGTGYSSLGGLQQLPVREVKIDRSFIAGMNGQRGDATTVRATIDIARTHGWRAVAEGIEDEAVRARLAALGCDLGQGYLFSPPVEGDALAAWAAAREASAIDADATF